jgi:hypothetical protein
VSTRDAVNTITCGFFRALPIAAGQYKFTCSELPEWSEQIGCTQREAGILVVDLQDCFRDRLKPKARNAR